MDNNGEAAAAWQEGRLAWPGVEIELERFRDYVDKTNPPPTADAGDLYLACGCIIGLPAAHTAFEREHHSDIRAALSRMALPAAMREDIEQDVMTKLFVDGRIARFSGRGRLRSWVRAVAVRAALDVLRSEKSGPTLLSESVVEALSATADDPQIEMLKQRYRDAVNRAFAAALAGLDDGDRNLLRLHYLRGLNIDRIGAMYGIHRVTAFRRLGRARDAVLSAARRALSVELEASELSSDGVLKLVRSQIEVSLERLLGDPSDDD